MGNILDFFSTINDGLIFCLGQVMKLCYFICRNYGLSIILFTLITKVILLPLAIIVQINSIKMVKLMPEQNALKIKYVDDKDKYTDAQLALYKKHKYNPIIGIIPLLIQIPLVLGLVGVIYRPISYVLSYSSSTVNALKEWLITTLNGAELTNQYQLEIVSKIKDGIFPTDASLSEAVSGIVNLDTKFLGIDLSLTPGFHGNYILLLIPVLSGLSAWFLCVMQNKYNVMQLTQEKPYMIATTVFMIAFSTYFAFLVPAGVGLYWIFGNLFAVPSMLLVNLIIPPKKHVDYEYFEKQREEKAKKDKIRKEFGSVEKKDYKRFCAVSNMKLMIYSEQNGFYKYYAGIIDYICDNSDLEIHYVTSDPKDNIFKDPREQIKSYYIASDKYLIPLFMKLDTDICLLTTPDLDKYQLKRSKVRKDVEYIYTDHAMASVNLTLRKGALNHYDTIFCCGPDYVEEIRAIENLYGTKKKRLVETGYPLIDDMVKSYENSEHPVHDRPMVLIAPSWQPDNIFESCIHDLLKYLKGGDYDIILRPHPQQVRHMPELFDELRKQYETEGSNIKVDTDFSKTNPVMEADILITDWSDICWEYAFTTKRPVLFIDTPMKVMNPDYEKIDIVPKNIKLRNVIGKSVDPSKAEEVKPALEYLLSHTDDYTRTIDDTFHEYIFNIGKSKILCGRYILKRLGK
ncbi:MAG: membrane protein insertase YidC [Clostridiales bacterium]|nr:membrane protein insertase YidC [Clostridiales bacterium]